MSYEEIRPIFEKTWDSLKSFKPIDFEAEKREKESGGRKKSIGRKTSKRSAAKEELLVSSKKQKQDDESEKAKLREYMDIIEDEDQLVDVTPLSARASITDWGIHSIDICSIYLIDRADGSTKSYRFLHEMFKVFDRDDVEDLYKLVKERYKSKKPEAKPLVLWGDLKTMFEPDENDEVWKISRITHWSNGDCLIPVGFIH